MNKTLAKLITAVIPNRKLRRQSWRRLMYYRPQEQKIIRQKVRHYLASKSSRKARVVVYTAISGNYDQLIDHHHIVKDWDYICFTDQKIKRESHWKIQPLTHQPNLDQNRQAKIYKVLPQQFLQDYDYSIWVDGNIDIRGPYLEETVNQLIENKSALAVCPHPFRTCLYEEAESCILLKRDSQTVINQQIEFIRSEGFPERYGLNELNVIFRQHNTPETQRLMNDWWEMIKKFSRRDQLSFTYLLWKNGISPDYLFPKPGVNLRQHRDFEVRAHIA